VEPLAGVAERFVEAETFARPETIEGDREELDTRD
jgi:hypothetical protein